MRFLSLALLLAASPALAGPSFDCGKARSRPEKAICASKEASDLDAKLAAAYKAALARLADDPEAVKALRTDQQTFIRYRDEFIDNQNLVLESYLADRLAFLERIDPGARDNVHGEWRSVWGVVRIARDAKGATRIVFFWSQPAIKQWTCGDPEEAGAGREQAGAVVSGDARSGLRFERSGRLLSLRATGSDESDPDPGCSHLGDIPHRLFPVLAANARPAAPASAEAPKPQRTARDYFALFLSGHEGNDHRFFVNATRYLAPPLAERREILARGESANWKISDETPTRLLLTHKKHGFTVELLVKVLEREYVRVTSVNPHETNRETREWGYHYRLLEDGAALDSQTPNRLAMAGDALTPPLPYKAIPTAVTEHFEKIDICWHYANEEPDGPDRERKYRRAITPAGCKAMPKLEAELKAKFRDNPAVAALIERALPVFNGPR